MMWVIMSRRRIGPASRSGVRAGMGLLAIAICLHEASIVRGGEGGEPPGKCFCEWTNISDSTDEVEPTPEGSNSAEGNTNAGWEAGGSPTEAWARVWGFPGPSLKVSQNPYSSFSGYAQAYTASKQIRWACLNDEGKLAQGAPKTIFRCWVARRLGYDSQGNAVAAQGAAGFAIVSGYATSNRNASGDDESCNKQGFLELSITKYQQQDKEFSVRVRWPIPELDIGGSLSWSEGDNAWTTGPYGHERADDYACYPDNGDDFCNPTVMMAASVAATARCTAQAGNWAHGCFVRVWGKAQEFTFEPLQGP